MLQDVLINLKTNTQNSKKTNLLEFSTYLKLQHVFVGVFSWPEFISGSILVPNLFTFPLSILISSKLFIRILNKGNEF